MIIEVSSIFAGVGAIGVGSNRLSHYFRKRPDSFSMSLKSYLEKEEISDSILIGIPEHDIRIIENTAKGRFVLGHISNEKSFKPICDEDKTIKGIFTRYTMTAFGTLMPFSVADMDHGGPVSLRRPNKYDERQYVYMPKDIDGSYTDFDDKRVKWNPEFKRLLNIYVLAHELKHTEQKLDERENIDADGIAIEAEADMYGLYALESQAPLSNLSEFIMHRRALGGLETILFNLYYEHGKKTAPVHETTLILDAWRQGNDLPSCEQVNSSVEFLIEKLGDVLVEKHEFPLNKLSYGQAAELARKTQLSDIIDDIDIKKLRAENALSARLVELWIEADEASSKPLDEYLPAYKHPAIDASPA